MSVDKDKQVAAVDAAMWATMWPFLVILGIFGAVAIGMIFWLLYRLLVILVLPGAA